MIIAVLAALALAGLSTYAVTGDPNPLNTNAAIDSGRDYSAEVATDGAGNWVAVWVSEDDLGGTIGTDRDILVAMSSNDGDTWTAPTALDIDAAANLAEDFSPQVTTDGAGNWLVVWFSDASLAHTIGLDYDILAARSTDNGATWTAPGPLNGNASVDSARDSGPQVATDGNGNWVAVWESEDDLGGTVGADFDILAARSTDNGATWTVPVIVNNNAISDWGNDFNPSVTTDGNGNWVAVWESKDDLGGTIGADRDILVAHSTDNGATWMDPGVLNSNASTDLGHDFGPQVTTDGAGNWVAVWEQSRSIMVSRSTDNGKTWTALDLLHTAGDSRYPQVTTDGYGNWVSVWYSNDTLNAAVGTDDDIFVALSVDNGATWTTPAALNSNATTDAGSDATPQQMTDGASHWVTVWVSTDSLNGTIGTDSDILQVNCSPLDTDCDGVPESGPGAPTPTPTPTPPPTPTARASPTPTAVPSPRPLPIAVGGIVEPAVPLGAAQLPDTGGQPGGSSESPDGPWLPLFTAAVAVLAAAVAAAGTALAASAWHARKRWLR